MEFTSQNQFKNISNQKYQKICVLIILAIVILFDDIGDSAINLAIPPISAAFHGDLNLIQWILNGYLITAAAFLVFAGGLGDAIGAKKVFITGLSLFTFSSTIAGFAHTSFVLISARILQGLSFSLTYPMIIILAKNAFPTNQQGKLMGVMSAFGGLALAIGPPLAGYLLHIFGWRSVFLINLPLGGIALLLAVYILGEDKSADINNKSSLDYVGLMLLACSLLSLFAWIIELDHLKLFSTWSILLMCTGVVSFFTLVKYESITPQPLLEFKLFTNRNFYLGNWIRFCIQCILFNIFFVFSLLFQNILNYTPLQSGCIFMTMTLSIVILSYFTGKLIDKVGYPLVLKLSIILLLITCLLFTRITLITHTLSLIFIFLFAGVAISFFLPAINTTVLNDIPSEKSGLSAGFYFMIVTLSGGIGVIISSHILAMKSKAVLSALLLSSHIILNQNQKELIYSISSATTSINAIKNAFIPNIQPIILNIINESFYAAYHLLIWIWISLTLLAFIASLSVKR